MFNRSGRKKNIIRISIVSGMTSGLGVVIQFLYRTFFLYVLTKEYLGIEGMFSNVIQVLSLAELGIGVVISYKLYEPIANKNTYQIAGMMRFYKKVYRVIAGIVILAGILMIPFLPALIKDASEIPEDVNLYIVYCLFLFQAVSSYFFTYKQTLLVADQKGDIVAVYNFASVMIKCIVQIVVLSLTKNYQLMLLISILLGVFMNYLFSLYITAQYREAFRIKAIIDEQTKRGIFADTKAMLCHKIGGTILGSTDNLVLSACVGLGQLGIYANYSLIIQGVTKIFSQALGNFTASLGNAFVLEERESNYSLYLKCLKINFWMTNISTVCIYILINPFITIWQGKNMLLSDITVISIAICYFINTVRLINISFTNACGLFNRDVIRPLFEVVINLVTSVLMAQKYGVVGVFAGTILSHICTTFWREPYLLYKYAFHKNLVNYWVEYIKNFILVLAECIICKYGFNIEVSNLRQWIIQLLITLTISGIFIFVFYFSDVKLILSKVWKKKKL